MVRALLVVVALLAAPAWAQKKILVALSEATTLALRDGKSFTTGNYLNEFAIPLMALIDAGYTPLYATPTGKKPNLDSDSVNVSYFGGDQPRFERAQALFRGIGPAALSGVDLAGVAAVFVPGGHAPMIDLLINRDLGRLLRSAHEKGITTGLICHGPIALLAALPDPAAFVSSLRQGKVDAARAQARGWIYQGYRMTIFSNSEEKIAEGKKLKGQMEFYPQDALGAAGGDAKASSDWSSHVVVDRELITGQNPNSVDEFAAKLVAAVRARAAR